MRVRTIALIAAAAVGLGACGDDKADTASTAAGPVLTAVANDPTGMAAGISTDVSKKPSISKPTGDPPTKLITTDIVVGKGRGAQAGDSVVMHYVGALYATGKQFEASWDAGRPYPFVLGEGNVIAGWDQGLVGMKLGGRRLLTIPPDLAYGAKGQGAIGANQTLVFVVDLLNDTPGTG